jgi:two-component system sensor histidine kinase PilS (NtrC family)
LTLPSLNSEEAPHANWYWTFHRGDGREFFLDLSLTDLRAQEADSEWGRLLVFQDRTRMVQMEEEVKRVEKMALLGRLAAGVAHEIRNPLASMSGSFQMLSADLKDDPDKKSLLEIIGREMGRLNNIVNDFLMFARPRPGRPARFDVSGAVQNNLRLFAHQIETDENIQVDQSIEPGLFAWFDEHQFEQIMWNLLRNAVEAMPDGGALSVEARANSHGVKVTVQDEGPGIDQADLSRIFDPFYTTKETGAGLGLSIVQSMAETGGGRITAKNRPGRGAAFTLWLPAGDES